MRYQGKSAVIVGGTHGIGKAIASLLLAQGARVLVTGRNPENVQKARRELGERAIAVRSDGYDLRDIGRLGEVTRTELGTLDAAFLNLGIAALEPFDRVSEASYDRHFDLNAKGLFFTAQTLAPLVRDGGALVFTTVTPAPAFPTMSVYTATKAAVSAFVRGLAAELVVRGVRVNAVAPGFIDTPTLGIASATPEERRELSKIGDATTPMKRHGRAEEVAAAAIFLAFEATFTTGIELPVDGGLSQIEGSPG